MLGYDTYVQAKYGRGCCIYKNTYDSYHKSCVCDHIHEKDQCQEICSNDTLCKGFAILFQKGTIYDPASCSIATNVDECPINCRGPYHIDHVAPLYPDAKCGGNQNNERWDGGCYIKQGMFVKMSSEAFSMCKYDFKSLIKMKKINFFENFLR